jgi:hypothetical protein
MVAYEFATTLLKNGHVVLPESYIKYIPVGSSLRVLVLLDELGVRSLPPSSTHPELTAQEKNLEPEKELALEQFVKQLKQTPINPAMIQPGNMALLAERLANPLTAADPNFDPIEWERLSNEHEAKMKAFEQAKAEQEFKAMADFFVQWQSA